MTPRLAERLLVIAVSLTLVALAFMMWGLLGHGPIPIFMAMSVGQAIGTLAFLLYLFVIVAELWILHGSEDGSDGAPESDAPDGADGPAPASDRDRSA